MKSVIDYILKFFQRKPKIPITEISENSYKIIRVSPIQHFLPKLYENVSFDGIVIHHSLTEDGTYKDSESIKRYHTSYRIDGNIVSEEEFNRRKAMGLGKVFEKPWIDIGYHGLIERVDGKLQTIKGRDWNLSGAHSGVLYKGILHTEYNKWFGLCIIGNFDIKTPDDELWEYTLNVCRELCTNFNIKVENVIGHREVFDRLGIPRQKTCPGARFNMDKFREDLNEKINI